MLNYVQIVTTTQHREEAERIGRTLVDQRLAACAQVAGPIRSTYRWRGTVETAVEWQCVAKSRLDLFDQVQRAIRGLHPYEVPEMLAVPLVAGSADYLAWLDAELQPAETGEGRSPNLRSSDKPAP
jgi:periplasmic divalent cation tolerance protein